MPQVNQLLLVGWTGMRGVVSLAAALALPAAFPFRNLILFVVFRRIRGDSRDTCLTRALVTLVGP